MKHLMTLLALVVAVTAGAQEWNPDYDQDGLVGTADLLALLSVFGVDDDGDGIWGGADLCTDVAACNYQANPTEECQYLDAIGECGGYCEEDLDGDGICDWTCGADLVSYAGYDYETVQIGSQCWFAEHSRYLPEVTPSNLPSAYNSPNAMVLGYNGQDISEAMESPNYVLYGVLYNEAAFNQWQNCPNGWHEADGSDWTLLIEAAGGITQAGLNLKDSINWNGTDSLGFNMLNGPMTLYNSNWRGYKAMRYSNGASYFFSDLSELFYQGRPENEMFPLRCVKD